MTFATTTEVLHFVDARQPVEHHLMACLRQEVPDAVVGEIMPVLRAQALVDDDQR
jgi:hypothetical protein